MGCPSHRKVMKQELCLAEGKEAHLILNNFNHSKNVLKNFCLKVYN